MKLIIDIDDEQVLFDIKNRGLEAETETDKVIINALYNGIPLPKGHGNLIDYDDLIEKLDRYGRKNVKYQLPYSPTIIFADKGANADGNSD